MFFLFFTDAETTFHALQHLAANGRARREPVPRRTGDAFARLTGG